MYDFLFSEIWWMQTIISSLITVELTLLTSILFLYFRLDSVLYEIKKLRDSNQEQKHELGRLTEKLFESAKENRSYSSLDNDLSEKINKIRELFLTEQINQKYRHITLEDNQKKMIEKINGILIKDDSNLKIRN